MSFMRSEIRSLQLEFWDYSNRRLGVISIIESARAWKEFEKYFEVHESTIPYDSIWL